MRDKKCGNCKEGRIDSKRNKSSLCTKCLQKKWNEEHKEEVKAYSEKYMKKYRKDNREKNYKVERKYYLKHKKKMDKIKKQYYIDNMEKCKKQSKEHYEVNKEELLKKNLEYYHKRYKTDEGFKMRRLLGTALGYVIRHYIKTGKVANPMKKYFIDWRGIIEVLVPIPQPRKDYHVDHISPLCRFDLTNWEQIHIAFAPENHRWILAEENMKRSKRRPTTSLN